MDSRENFEIKRLKEANALLKNSKNARAYMNQQDSADEEIDKMLNKCNFTDEEKEKLKDLFHIKTISYENSQNLAREMEYEFGNLPNPALNNRAAANNLGANKGGYRGTKKSRKTKKSKKSKKSRKTRSSK